MVLASVVMAGGGDLTEVQLSRSCVLCKRRVKQGKKIMDSFFHSDSYVLHYDTKLVNPNGRAAVLYSGNVHQQPYLLGTVFQHATTFSNSDYKEGAHFRIEKKVGHAILELKCRKHIREWPVTHANKAVIGATKGPQKAHYKHLNDAWSFLEFDTSRMDLFDWDEFSEESFLLERSR
jgi:hypothetical protein